MATAHDVTAYILSHRTRTAMESVRLQKLLYYAQAWHLVTMDSPLYEDDITAFEYGPVVYSVWDKYRYKRTITRRTVVGNPDALTETEQEVVDAVVEVYRKIDPFDLADLTHQEDPWVDAWSGDKRITHSAMRDYYARDAVRPPAERTTPQIPHIPDARVTYLRDDEFSDILTSLDEPDDVSGILAAVTRKRK